MLKTESNIMLIMTHKIIHPADACTCNMPALLKRYPKIYNNVNVGFTKSQLGQTYVSPNSKLKTVGDGSYQFGIPQLWNELPLILHCVKSLKFLKSNLKLKFLFT